MSRALSETIQPSSTRPEDGGDNDVEDGAGVPRGGAAGGGTIADGIAARQPGALTPEIVRRLGIDAMLVDEGEIEDAMLILLVIGKTLVEGAPAPSRAPPRSPYALPLCRPGAITV